MQPKKHSGKTPEVRLKASLHFVARLLERQFDLSVLKDAAAAMCQVRIGDELEVTNGVSTVVCVRIAADQAILKTGYANAA